MITLIHQPTRVLTVRHSRHVEVSHYGYSGIIVSYVNKCNTCDPEIFQIEEGDKDLDIEIGTPFD